MGKVLSHITEDLKIWIEKQKMFFVATAPMSMEGHINCSPKGMDSFRILDQDTVCYMDLTGSGIETMAHLKENGRILVMFCGFDGPPQIVRLHGMGEALVVGKEFDQLKRIFPVNPGLRSIIKIQVNRVSTSCGFGVPYYDYKSDREILKDWALTKGEAGVKEYQLTKNLKSIDGLSGIK